MSLVNVETAVTAIPVALATKRLNGGEAALHEAEWPVEHIKVAGRIRQHLGDIDGLVASIEDVGLLEPIVIDRNLNLIAGQRRLEAVKRLGWATVRVTVAANVTDAASALRAERDENLCREAMTVSEQVAMTERLMELERPAALERMAEGGKKSAPGRPAESLVSGDTDLSGGVLRTEKQSAANAVRNIAGTAAGWSGPSYQRAKAVLNTAKDDSLPKEVRDLAGELAEKMDRGDLTVTSAHNKIQAAKKKARPSPAVANTSGDNEAVDRSSSAVRQREEAVRRMAGEAYTSRQIAGELGISLDAVKSIAKRIGVEVPADKIIGRSRRINSTRVVEQAVLSAENVTAGVDLIDYSELDPSQRDEWVSYAGLTEEEEAEKFLKLNDTLTVDGFYKFRVGVHAGREAECEINRVVMANGCVVSRDDVPGGVRAVGTLRRIYERAGSEVLGRTLRIILGAYGDSGLEAAVIDGIGHVCSRYNGALDEAKAIERLSKAAGGANGLLGRAEELRRRTGNTKGHCVAAATVEVINRGRGGGRLPSWWKSDA